MASQTYTLTMSNSWCSGTFKVSNTAAGKITVTLSLWRTDGGTSKNSSAEDNFYITIAGSKKTFTITSISSTKVTKTYTKDVSVSADGSGSVAVSVGGSVTGTTFSISGNNSKTYSFTDGDKATYKITYNANGGTGAPAQQTKTYGKAITLSSTVPTREGYNFSKWNTASGGTGTNYNPGASYSSNAALTLYAQWTKKTYSVTYNANGGSGTISAQTKTHGTNLTLASSGFTRTNYTLKGWSTSENGDVIYNLGSSYTIDAVVTLYAVWELAYWPPNVYGITAERCSDTSGTLDENGKYAKLTFSWETCQLLGTNNISSIVVNWKESTTTSYPSGNKTTVSSSGTSKTNVSVVIGGNALSTDKQYDIQIVATDSKSGVSSPVKILPKSIFLIDFKTGGNAVAFGKPAELDDTAEFAFTGLFNKLDVKTGYGINYRSTTESSIVTTLAEIYDGIYASNSGTGIMKIALPIDFPSSTSKKIFIRFDVDIFSYYTMTLATYSFGAQLSKNSSGTYAWSNASYHIHGTSNSSNNIANLPISFGRHGSKCAVSIGTSSTNWSYCSAAVRNIRVSNPGNAGSATIDAEGWVISVSTAALDTVLLTYTNPAYQALKSMGANDFIIETGTTTGSWKWEWTKYASGKMYCECTRNPSLTASTAYGNGYYTNQTFGSVADIPDIVSGSMTNINITTRTASGLWWFVPYEVSATSIKYRSCNMKSITSSTSLELTYSFYAEWS